MNISIHAPREGSDRFGLDADAHQGISIHAPREGSDRRSRYRFRLRVGISIHAPREGSDAPAGPPGAPTPNFNPRSP